MPDSPIPPAPDAPDPQQQPGQSGPAAPQPWGQPQQPAPQGWQSPPQQPWGQQGQQQQPASGPWQQPAAPQWPQQQVPPAAPQQPGNPQPGGPRYPPQQQYPQQQWPQPQAPQHPQSAPQPYGAPPQQYPAPAPSSAPQQYAGQQPPAWPQQYPGSPQQYAGQQPYAGQPQYAAQPLYAGQPPQQHPGHPGHPGPAQPAAPRRRRTGMILGIAGGGVGVVAIGVVLALVLPGLLAPAASSTLVADLGSRPVKLWSADYTLGSDPKYLSAPLVSEAKNGRVLVASQLDTSALSDGSSAGWYDGYDEDYAKGYTAGAQYKAAEDAFFNSSDFSAPIPNEDDYWPGTGSFTDSILDPKQKGISDGFGDGMLGEPEGTSKVAKPVTPDYHPTVEMLDGASGKAAWKLDVEKKVDGVDWTTGITAVPVGDGAIVEAIVASTDGTSVDSTLLAVNGSGAVTKKREFTGSVMARTIGDRVFTLTRTGTSGGTLAELDPAKLADRWSTHVSGGQLLPLGERWLEVRPTTSYDSTTGKSTTTGSGRIYDAATGKPAPFGPDVAADVDYWTLGDSVVRVEGDGSDGYRLSGVNPSSGAKTWSATADDFFVTDGGLITARKSGSSSYDGVQRIDPSTGKGMWSSAWSGSFRDVTGETSDLVVLRSTSSAIVLDAKTGARRATHTVDKDATPILGASTLYVDGENGLTASPYLGSTTTWDWSHDAKTGVRQSGTHLYALDVGAHELSLLGDR